MSKESTLVIHEIYASIQGESTFAGLPCTFVRTTGCNLRCTWCDTPQAFHGGTRMQREDYEWMRSVIREKGLASRTPNLLASTVFGKLAARDLVTWVLEDALPVRVQLQMHKYIWGAEATGV